MFDSWHYYNGKWWLLQHHCTTLVQWMHNQCYCYLQFLLNCIIFCSHSMFPKRCLKVKPLGIVFTCQMLFQVPKQQRQRTAWAWTLLQKTQNREKIHCYNCSLSPCLRSTTSSHLYRLAALGLTRRYSTPTAHHTAKNTPISQLLLTKTRCKNIST